MKQIAPLPYRSVFDWRIFKVMSAISSTTSLFSRLEKK
jgi:hypothetical protein